MAEAKYALRSGGRRRVQKVLRAILFFYKKLTEFLSSDRLQLMKIVVAPKY